MLNCNQATHLCSAEQERDLTLREQVGLSMHTMMCKGCKNYRKHMKFLRLAAQRYAEGDAVPIDDDAPGDGMTRL